MVFSFLFFDMKGNSIGLHAISHGSFQADSVAFLVELALHGGCDGSEAIQRLLEDVDEVGSLSTISAPADQGLLHRNYLRTIGDYSRKDFKQPRRSSTSSSEGIPSAEHLLIWYYMPYIL